MTLKICPSPWQPKPLRPGTTLEQGQGLWEQLGLEADAAPLWWVLSFTVWLWHKKHECGFGQEQLQSSTSPSAPTAQDEVVAKKN